MLIYKDFIIFVKVKPNSSGFMTVTDYKSDTISINQENRT